MVSFDDYVAGELEPYDAEQAYANLIDDTYDFRVVGGPFAHMSPSSVLAKIDPVWWRCGVNDFIDAEEKDGVIVEVGDCYYLKDEVDALRDEWEAEQGQVSA